jgi:phage-related protein
MNYVVLNGVKSTEVAGLLIEELPPIVKPAMRIETELVDGRAGDIVTELGYSAYDREMKIGLFGDFNIDDVVAFFASSGSAVFSNEPEKVYDYAIYDQIDFKRLMRFREATVKFHVQPYKRSATSDTVSYSAEQYGGAPDATIEKNGVTATMRGGVLHLSGTAEIRTEILVDLNRISLAPSIRYALYTTVDGDGAEACTVRLIEDTTPSDAESFAGNPLPIEDGGGSTGMRPTADTIYRRLWVNVPQYATVDFSLALSIVSRGVFVTRVINHGNVASKPKITVKGRKTSYVYIDGHQVFSVRDELGSLSEYEITVDTEDMSAYSGDRLMNRYIRCDYDEVSIPPGEHTVSWSYDISGVKVENISRWI